jgi:N-acetylmuramoyl-L-alanine amidase-like protein
MWANFDRSIYDRAGFVARIASLKWTGWKPQGITLHNTGAPTLKQWVESGPSHDQRILNLQRYYEGMGWHAGPHFFVSRSHVSGFSNPLQSGVHSTCFNRTHLGIEMAGNFSAEPFDSGDGALVRDMAVFTLATLFHALGLDPHKLRFHRECVADHHACPGKNVSQSDMIGRVAAAMGLRD